MAMQIKLVATGYTQSVKEYVSSNACALDNVGFVVDRDGSVVQCGNSTTVAIMNSGPVVLHNGKWMPAKMNRDGSLEPIPGATPVRVPYEYCSCHKYHGFQHYEMIGGKQLRALKLLLRELMNENGITFPYDNQLGEICPRAIAGGSGIYLASSYNKNRSDVHPQVDLINIIKSLAL